MIKMQYRILLYLNILLLLLGMTGCTPVSYTHLANGCGKTTLLKILQGTLPADSGTIRRGVGVMPGYYDQTQAGLHPEKTALNEIWDSFPRMTETEVRSALAVFLFLGDTVFKQVSLLSGGEKARLLLLKLMLSKANFLILDEPTNHLDIGSREALEDALLDYGGTLLMVSHDRYFINKLADRILVLNPDGIEEYICLLYTSRCV